MIEEISKSINLSIPQAKSFNEINIARQSQTNNTPLSSISQVKEIQKLPTQISNNLQHPLTSSNISSSQLKQKNEISPLKSNKKVRLNKLMGKLNKSLEDFFLKDGPEESSYVDDFSMIKHYYK